MLKKYRRSYSAQTILRKSKGPFPKEVLNAGEDLFTALYSKNIEEIKRKVKKNRNGAGRKPALKCLEVLEEEPENWTGENHEDTFDALLKDERPSDYVNSCRNSLQGAENKENRSGLYKKKFKDDKKCGMVKKTHGFTKCGWRSVNSHICSKKNKKNFKNSRKTKRLIPVNNTYIDLLESFNSLSDLTEQFLSGKVDIKGVKRNSSKFKMQELTGKEETSFQKNSDAEPDEEFLHDKSRHVSKSRLTVVNRNCAVTDSSLKTINSRRSKNNSRSSINTPDDDDDDDDNDYLNSSQYLHVLTQQILSGKESNITFRRKEYKRTPQRPTGREISCNQINYQTESAEFLLEKRLFESNSTQNSEIPVNSTPLNFRTKISACHLSPIDPLFYTKEAQLHEDENEDVRCGDASHSTPVCSRTYIIHSNCKSEQKSTSTFRADSSFEEVEENFSPKNVKIVDNNSWVDTKDFVSVIISQEALAMSPDPFVSYITLPGIDKDSLNVSSKENQCFSASNDNSMKVRRSLEESLFKEKEITEKSVSADISSESERFLREGLSLLCLDYNDAKNDPVSQSVINCTKEITGEDVNADISSESERFLREGLSLLCLDYNDAKNDPVSQSVINCTKEITGKDVSADISSESEGFLRERLSLLSLDYNDAKSDSVSQSVINCTKEVNSLCATSMLERNLHPKQMNITRPTFGFRKTVNVSCRYSSRRSHIVIPVNKNFEGSLIHSRFQSAYCYPEEHYERHFECNESDESISDTRHYDNIFKKLVLEHCGQEHAISFETLFSDCDLKNSKKIGEGVYGEVFTRIYTNGKATVMKILPIEGSCEINGERQKSFEEILPEIVITKELSNLRINECFCTGNFPELVHCWCVQGSYPSNLLTLWNKYNEEKGSENDSPEILPIDQMYIILEMSNAGTDLESFVFTTAAQTVSVFKQIVCTLAAAEAALEFEHRDLHWGNILLKETKAKTITWKLFGKEYVVNTKGIQASVIDFTLSRITYGGCSIFNNLADDPAIFEGEGDYQFEIYRLMKNQVRDNWEQFEPYNNVLWLSYVLEKLIKEVHYKKRSLKTHKNSIIELRKFQKEIMNFQSAIDVAQFLFRKVR